MDIQKKKLNAGHLLWPMEMHIVDNAMMERSEFIIK